MVAPFTSYSKIQNRGTVTFKATGLRQKPPYVNTAYSCNRNESFTGFMSPDMTNIYMESTISTAMTIATNIARGKLVGKLGDLSQVGSTLTSERKATYGTLNSLVVTAFQTARAVRKGQLNKAAQILGLAPPEQKTVTIRRRKSNGMKRKSGRRVRIIRSTITLPTGKVVAHTAANRWLWWSYGIKPLVQDMYNCVDVLQRPLPYERIEGWGMGSGSYRKVYSANSIHSFGATARVKMSLNVRVGNPNLFLANQMGLTNPLQWINEGIPFSFVIDWFSNLSQVIAQFTDFTGVETSDPMTSSKTVLKTSMPTVYGYERAEKRAFTRTLSIPPAKLRFAYERFQWQRGANAISLLVSFLKKN